MKIPWKTMTSEFASLRGPGMRKKKKQKLSVAGSPWDFTWNVCLCAHFIKGNVNLLLGHISARQLYLEDRSACLFSSSNKAWGCQVGASEGLRSERSQAFSVQVKICKIGSSVTSRAVALPRLSKDLQFYFHLNYDRKGQTENTFWPKCEFVYINKEGHFRALKLNSELCLTD